MRPVELLDHPARVIALVRLAALPVFLAGERLIDHPDARSGAFRFVLLLGAVYAILAARAAFSDRPHSIPGRVTAGVDLLLLALLTYTSGGPFSQLRYGFFMVPVAAALLPGSPQHRRRVARGARVLPGRHDRLSRRSRRRAPGRADAIALLRLARSRLDAAERHARPPTAQIVSLSDERGRLVVHTLEAEERERRRLAESLHDDAMQNLLAARQALGSADSALAPDLALVRTGLDRPCPSCARRSSTCTRSCSPRGPAAALQAVADRVAERAPGGHLARRGRRRGRRPRDETCSRSRES